MSDTANFELSIVIDRYAVAMIALAEEQNMLDAIDADLALVKDIIVANSDLKEFINHPLIKLEDKKDSLEKIFNADISEHTLNLIKVLSDKNRLFILQYIADCYHKLLCEKRNIATAQVVTAIPIDETTINRVKEKLCKMLDKQIRIESIVDKEIIAGMVIKIDDKVIDGSVKTKIKNMKKQLIKG